jgi:hypothetical protein
MRVQPILNYNVLGTGIKLDSKKVYRAILAINQPEYKEKGKIFLLENGNDLNSYGVLLERGEYKIIK